MGLSENGRSFATAAGQAAVNKASLEAWGGRAPIAEGISIL